MDLDAPDLPESAFKDFIALDVETTGLEPSHDRMIALGAVEVRNGVVMSDDADVFHAYMDPEMAVPEHIVRNVHGITREDAIENGGGKKFKDIIPDFIAFLEARPKAVLFAHNASFDVGFLEAEMKRCGMKPLHRKVHDSIAEAQKSMPKLGSWGLDALMRRFQIAKTRGLHGALKDSILLAKVIVAMSRRKDQVQTQDFISGGAQSQARRPMRTPHAKVPAGLAAQLPVVQISAAEAEPHALYESGEMSL